MRILTRLLLAAALLAATMAGAREPVGSAAAGAPPEPSGTLSQPAAGPSPAPSPKPLDEFVPRERVPADAEVPFPVDI